MSGEEIFEQDEDIGFQMEQKFLRFSNETNEAKSTEVQE